MERSRAVTQNFVRDCFARLRVPWPGRGCSCLMGPAAFAGRFFRARWEMLAFCPTPVELGVGDVLLLFLFLLSLSAHHLAAWLLVTPSSPGRYVIRERTQRSSNYPSIVSIASSDTHPNSGERSLPCELAIWKPVSRSHLWRTYCLLLLMPSQCPGYTTPMYPLQKLELQVADRAT